MLESLELSPELLLELMLGWGPSLAGVTTACAGVQRHLEAKRKSHSLVYLGLPPLDWIGGSGGGNVVGDGVDGGNLTV